LQQRQAEPVTGADALRGTSGPHEVRVLHGQRVAMRDGVACSADVYLPRGLAGPLPTIYQWTPYESTRDRFVGWGIWFASRGYAAVVQDVRGRYESGGEFVAYHRDGEDAYDSLDWAAGEPWCDGNIGTWGRSYGAIVQWQLAPLGHPALRCLAPHVIMDDYFADCHYVGGAFQLALSLGAALIWSTTIGLVTGENAADTVLHPRVFRHLPLVDLDREAIGREIPFWREWLEHATDDDYWRVLRHRAEDLTVPLFQQCGWYDAYAGATMRTFNRVNTTQRVLLGPWSHEEEVERSLGGVDFGPAAARFIRDDELRWYDHWLRGIDTGLLAEPPIALFTMGRNEWRRDREWPPPGTRFEPWHLRVGGGLSPDPPRAGEEPDRYAYDPADPVPTLGGNNSLLTMTRFAADRVVPGPLDQRPLEARDDVLVYSSEPLGRDLEVTGPVEAVLHAATDARDTDFVVRLCDVQPDGRSLVLSEGIVRARYRNGLGRQELVEPGEPQAYRIRMYPTSNLFRRGHRIRLDVTSSSFPRFSRNLNTGEDVATGTRMQVARQTILHSAEHPSHVLLPVVET
jgi:putative CocE/NonD family hydrolase